MADRDVVVGSVCRDVGHAGHEMCLPPHDSLSDHIVTQTHTTAYHWAILQNWVPYSQRYLFNAIPDTNHNANPTNPNP